jgi:hypothetical protein
MDRRHRELENTVQKDPQATISTATVLAETDDTANDGPVEIWRQFPLETHFTPWTGKSFHHWNQVERYTSPKPRLLNDPKKKHKGQPSTSQSAHSRIASRTSFTPRLTRKNIFYQTRQSKFEVVASRKRREAVVCFFHCEARAANAPS